MKEKVLVEVYTYHGIYEMEVYDWNEKKKEKDSMLSSKCYRTKKEENLNKKLTQLRLDYEVVQVYYYGYHHEEFSKNEGKPLQLHRFYPAQLERIYQRYVDEKYNCQVRVIVEFDNESTRPFSLSIHPQSKDFDQLMGWLEKEYDVYYDEEGLDEDDGKALAETWLNEHLGKEMVFNSKENGFIPEFSKNYDSYIDVFIEL